VLELAGGVRKLADIALALARRPKLLLLDEPTSGVSADEKFPAMRRVMDALEGEAATVVFIEHDMDIVAEFSERVIAFYSGRVIADGTPRETLGDADVQRHVTGGLK
jgi:branched-chain amino acid transport system ATP-binding protein